MIDSIRLLFSNFLELLSIPYVHVVYTVPPWLKFILPGVNMVVLPCVRTWENDEHRTICAPGMEGLRSLVEKRFSKDGLARFLGSDPRPRLERFITLSGGHFRDLLLLLRETVLRADALPASEPSIENAIISVRSHFLPIPVDDAKWLAQIERERASLLKNDSPEEIGRLAKFLDSHLFLYLKNGMEWYDIHPLVRDEVALIAAAGAR